MPRPNVVALVTVTLMSVLLMTACSALAPQSEVATESATSAADCSGVWVEVDFDVLSSATITTCVKTLTPLDGITVLNRAGITVEGTGDYGLDVVCRVNGRPEADESLPLAGHEDYRESCATMTPEFAYWSLWVEDRSTGAWEYAPVGIEALMVKPGESLGLTFTTGTHTDPPAP